jgi:hypothetical protein
MREERLERWNLCEDLAQQLVVSARKDAAKFPNNPRDMILQRVRDGIAGEDCCTVIELDWVMARLRVLLGW